MRISRAADLGALVAEQRERQGITQGDLAQQARVTREWLNRFERGAHAVTFNRVLRVLDALELELEVRGAV